MAIRVTFYKNGFEINGHSQLEVCGQVSILAWSCSNMIIKHDPHCDWYTSDHDGRPDVGYTHLTFNTKIEQAKWLFDLFKQNIAVWAEHYEWEKRGYVLFEEHDDALVIPPRFREPLGITASG